LRAANWNVLVTHRELNREAGTGKTAGASPQAQSLVAETTQAMDSGAETRQEENPDAPSASPIRHGRPDSPP